LNMNWLTAIVVVLLVLADAAPVQAGPRLKVYVYNLADVPQDTLNLAKNLAQKIFGASGIDVEWIQLPKTDSVTGSDVQVLMLTRSPEKLGHTTRGATVRGFSAWAFYDRVESFVADSGTRLYLPNMPELAKSRVLGSVIAHELGHALALDHSAEGIMKPQWNIRDFDSSGIEKLRFSRNEARRLAAAIR
jgi:hypothetical protein